MNPQPTKSPRTVDTDFDPETVNHWIRKADITRGIVEGVAAPTLCGDAFIPSSHDGITGNANSMVCPLCQLAYEQLRA